MRWWGLAAAVAVVLSAQAVVEGARILMLAPLAGISNVNFFMRIAEVLAARNHKITFLLGCKVPEPPRNIRVFFVPNVNLMEKLSYQNPFNSSMYSLSSNFMDLVPKTCADALASSEMQKIQEEEFDLVILSMISTECFYPYISSLKVPYIHMSPIGMAGSYSDQAGNPFFSSIAPNMILNLNYPLTFTGRLLNTLADTLFKAIAVHYMYPRIERECLRRNLWPKEYPSLQEMRINGSLLIINSVRTLESPVIPYVPAVVHAGDLYCRPARPLPKELGEWIAEAGSPGFIYFSLGSVVKPSFMPEEYKSVLLEVFASLEQRVLWKWDQDAMEGLPPNVRLAKWLPQQDVLGDPRLRLFMTHGGLLSTTEATYHGVPVLGLPLFADQHHNMGEVERRGWGRSLPWEGLSYSSLRRTILGLMHDTKVREEVARRSAVMRDRPIPTGDWVAFWVEYVLRHEGAYHLRCPATTMPWYRLYNVDVWLVAVAILALYVYISVRLFLAMLSCLCFGKNKKRSKQA